MAACVRRLGAGFRTVNRPRVESYTRDGGRFLTLRYGSGPLDPDFLGEIDAAIGLADLESSVTCIVLRLAHSPGSSSPPPLDHLPGDVIARRRRLDASVEAAHGVPKLVVFLIEDTVAGESIGLLALADVVLATNESVLRPGGVPAALLGMIPVLQRRRDGVRSALLCLLEGRDLDAHAARHLGLVTDVLPAERLEPVLDSLLRGVASAGPTAVAMLKAAAK